jgi:hypothetical protein
MGYEIIKVARDVDLYMEWSSIVDAPTFVGTRAETLAYLTRQADPTLRDEYQPPARLARADRTGTSAFAMGSDWNDTGHIYEQRGFLPRARFEAFARAAAADDESAMLALLDPLD